MSSRSRVAAVPPRTSASTTTTTKITNMRSLVSTLPTTTIEELKNEKTISSKLTATKVTAPQKDLSSIRMTGKTSSTTTRPLWMQSVKTFARSAPVKPSREKKEEEMVTSTGTESSGIFSDSEGTGGKHHAPSKPPRPLQSTSRISAAMAKTSKFVRRTSATPNDQLVIAELQKQIAALKNQHRIELDQLRHELGEQFQKDVTVLLTEKEAQFQEQLEAKEASWGTELSRRLEEERAEASRQLSEREAAVEASRSEERQRWQQQLDSLLKKANQLLADKERLEKNIRQEVESRVQATVQRYNELQKETSSLQAVFELRCQEVKQLRQDLERACAAAAEAPNLRERNLSLTNNVEGLEAQLELKNNEERRLQAEIALLKSHCKEESARSRRLSMEKEQLEYRLSLQLRNDCDRMSPTKGHHHLHNTTPLSSTTETPKLSRKTLPPINLSPIIVENGTHSSCSKDRENNNPSGRHSHNSKVDRDHDRDNRRCMSRSRTPPSRLSLSSSSCSAGDGGGASSDGDDVFSSTATGTSPAADPGCPTVRDFTEKTDSVSYVLDLGDEHSPNSFLTAPLPPPSPWQRRRNLVRFASLRYPHHSHS